MVALTGPGLTRAAEDAEFVGLVCADEQLLRAEFDAIVAAEWPGPPPDAPGGRCERERPGRPRTRRPARFTASFGARVRSWIAERHRQRSPPRRGRPDVAGIPV